MSHDGSGHDDDENECMICLFPLLGDTLEESKNGVASRSRISSSNSSSGNEIGAVFPCGHVFHLTCWQQWNKNKCPICNQTAHCFSKIFLTAPTSNSNSNHNSNCSQNSSQQKRPSSKELSNLERQELERYRRMDERLEHRMLLRDMEKRVEQDPQEAKAIMTMMMMVQSRDLRKAERELQASKDECQETKDMLQVVQAELEAALDELTPWKQKAASLQRQVERLKRSKQDAASQKTHEYKQQIKELQEKLDRAKDKLALKNKQLSRRNKELAAKKKVICDAKLELAAKGRESQTVCKKTLEELQRTKKELELLRELDSFTMNESFTSYGHGSSFNESLTLLD